MYDIIPPTRYKHSARSGPEKGKWSRVPSGRHWDIIAKKQNKEATALSAANVAPSQAFAVRERDIPYTFPKSASVSMPAAVPHMPHVTISLPHRGGRLPSLIILVIGFGLATFAIWNLQAAGSITGAFASVRLRVMQAISYSAQASSALAETHADAGQKSFSLAGQEFMYAKQEIDAALAVSHNILEFTDITRTLASTKKILEAGKSLTLAGEHIALAIKPFMQADENTSLTDAIGSAHTELIETIKYVDEASGALRGISTILLPKDVQEKVLQLQEALPKVRTAIAHLNAESSTLLTLLGADRDREYLVLFANSDELRPVGGFIGTTALINIARGKVENIDVKSVYDGDGQLRVAFAPPVQLAPIVNRWYLRDSNWFVDYRTSARKAAMLFEKAGGPTVDGVLLLTPQVIENILAVTGPIQVPGYATAVSAENFVTVTQREVTYNYDRSINKPKQFLADLAPILLSKLFASGSTDPNSASRLALLEAVTKSLSEKDILLYFNNEQAQQEAETLGWAGAIPQNKQGFLMVNNANIGGHKSDQFIEQEIDYRTVIDADGNADVVTTIRRTHKGPQESINVSYPAGEDPSKKDNVVFQRVLVPAGAVLLDAKGFTRYADIPKPNTAMNKIPLQADADVAAWQKYQHTLPDGTIAGQESGYQYFANWVVTKPGQTSVVLYHYTIPRAVSMPSFLKSSSNYSLALVKQPGQKRSSTRASIEVPSDMRILHTVPESGITLDAPSSLVYRGNIVRDTVVGAVFQQ